VTRLDRLATDATSAGFASPAVILVGAAIGESVERVWVEGEPMQGEPLAHEVIAHAA
jgi:uroporphyrin-III C-methyltransferase